MPIYEYRCENGHTFEVTQSMSDDPLASCTTCNASVQRVFHPVAVHFKGSGFYTTDYGRKKSGAGASSDEGPKKKDEKKSESKSSDSSSSD
jgi:putative FmdB family regulatory protein